MSFLDATPDLVGTGYSDADLAGARLMLTNILRADNPGWLDNPRGALGQHWGADSLHSTAYILYVAQVVNHLITFTHEDSMAILRRKVRDLFESSTEEILEDRLTELEVGALIGQHVSPIRFEPYADTPFNTEVNRATSPDYEIRLPEGGILLEVTRMRIGFLESWSRAARDCAERITGLVTAKQLRRSIEFSAPIEATGSQLNQLGTRAVLRSIEMSSAGELSFEMEPEPIRIRWSDAFDGPFIIAEDERVEHLSLASMSYRPIHTVDPGPRIIKSVRKSLDRKRDQMRLPRPQVLIVRLDQVNNEAVAEAIESRLFPNREYAWVSAIVLFHPTRSWTGGAEKSEFRFCVNPNATYPAPQSFKDILIDRSEFHSAPPRLPTT